MNIDKFTQDGQDPKVVEKIYNKIAVMLTQQEKVNYIALQKKPAVTLLPDSVTISNRRIFLCEFTKLGLATNFEIFDWNDIKDISFKEEIFGSKVTVIPFTGENLSIDYIPKTQARRLYQLIKDILEEIKSNNKNTEASRQHQTGFASPSLQEQPSSQPTEQQQENTLEAEIAADLQKPEAPIEQPHKESFIEPTQDQELDDELTLKLKKLKNLYDKQLISQAEYENKKAEILSQL